MVCHGFLKSTASNSRLARTDGPQDCRDKNSLLSLPPPPPPRPHIQTQRALSTLMGLIICVQSATSIIDDDTKNAGEIIHYPRGNTITKGDFENNLYNETDLSLCANPVDLFSDASFKSTVRSVTYQVPTEMISKGLPHYSDHSKTRYLSSTKRDI